MNLENIKDMEDLLKYLEECEQFVAIVVIKNLIKEIKGLQNKIAGYEGQTYFYCQCGGIDKVQQLREDKIQLLGEISLLTFQNKILEEENKKLKECVEYFVKRVEEGSIRSTVTYEKFKQVLEMK